MIEIKKAAQVVLINEEGLVLGVSRKTDHNDFGLPGGKVDPEDKDEMAALANYLSRPVNISTFTWTQTPMANYAGSFLPWHAYISDSKVYRKVQNYSRFHGKLHLKFVMNASPFFYGAIRVIYEPRRQFLDHGTSTLELVPASQTPGLWLTPQDMSSAEMVLPFLNENNWINPNSVSSLQDMGRICFYVYS